MELLSDLHIEIANVTPVAVFAGVVQPILLDAKALQHQGRKAQVCQELGQEWHYLWLVRYNEPVVTRSDDWRQVLVDLFSTVYVHGFSPESSRRKIAPRLISFST